MSITIDSNGGIPRFQCSTDLSIKPLNEAATVLSQEYGKDWHTTLQRSLNASRVSSLSSDPSNDNVDIDTLRIFATMLIEESKGDQNFSLDMTVADRTTATTFDADFLHLGSTRSADGDEEDDPWHTHHQSMLIADLFPAARQISNLSPQEQEERQLQRAIEASRRQEPDPHPHAGSSSQTSGASEGHVVRGSRDRPRSHWKQTKLNVYLDGTCVFEHEGDWHDDPQTRTMVRYLQAALRHEMDKTARNLNAEASLDQREAKLMQVMDEYWDWYSEDLQDPEFSDRVTVQMVKKDGRQHATLQDPDYMRDDVQDCGVADQDTIDRLGLEEDGAGVGGQDKGKGKGEGKAVR